MAYLFAALNNKRAELVDECAHGIEILAELLNEDDGSTPRFALLLDQLRESVNEIADLLADLRKFAAADHLGSDELEEFIVRGRVRLVNLVHKMHQMENKRNEATVGTEEGGADEEHVAIQGVEQLEEE